MIDKNNKQLSLTKQCQLVSLSKSVIYYLAKPESEQNVGWTNCIWINLAMEHCDCWLY